MAHAERKLDGVSTPLLIATLSALLTACVPLGSVRERLLSQEERTEVRAITPVGQPVATLDPHPDGLGWTVTVEQPIQRTIAMVREERWASRRYSFSPLGPPVGLFACPFVLEGYILGSVFEDGKSLKDSLLETCSLLVMIHRDSALRDTRHITITADRTEDAQEPVHDGRVLLIWGDSEAITIPYPLDPDGTAHVRLWDLIPALSPTGHPGRQRGPREGRIVVEHAGARLASWTVPIPESGLEVHPVRPLDRTRLCGPLVVSVAPVEGLDNPTAAALHRRLEAFLATRGVPVVSGEEVRPLVEHEQTLHHSGRVDDTAIAGVGHRLPATVLLTVRAQKTPGRTAVSLQAISIHTREVLQTLQSESGPYAWDNVVNLSLARLTALFTTDHARPLERHGPPPRHACR